MRIKQGRRAQAQAKRQSKAQQQKQIQARRVRIWRVSAGHENWVGQFKNWSTKPVSRIYGKQPIDFGITLESARIKCQNGPLHVQTN